ncbi:MAG: hypothetical protein WCP85_00915 [Mariniphaga sp.]
MKTISFIIVGLSLLIHCNTGFCNGITDNKTTSKPVIQDQKQFTISSTPELFDLTSNWAFQYEQLNPSIKINVVNSIEKQTINTLNFVSEGYHELNSNGANWKMVIGRDVIVPVINARNPMLKEIYSQGISSLTFNQFFADPQKQNWASLINGGQNSPIKYYIIDNEEFIGNLKNFAKLNSDAIGSKKLVTASEVISALQKDIFAIGFCKLTDLKEAGSNELITDLKLLPIDKNGNGRIDNFENIYTNMESFTRGVWIGKYPNSLCGSIYVSANSKPTDKTALDFLAWVMADGRQYLSLNGYSDLASSKIEANLTTLGYTVINTPKPNVPETSNTWLIVLVVLVITGMIVPIVVRTSKVKKSQIPHGEIQFAQGLNENSVVAPKGLYFDKTHTWAFMEKNGTVKVGIDDFLQHITGTITRIKMKEAGDKVRKGEKIMTIIHDGKRLNLYAPISGVIKEQNQSLISDSWLVNSSPYADGWVYLIEPKNWTREIQFMFMGEKYKEWLRNEFSRLKDFVADSMKVNTLAYSHVILQDGGELSDNVLADLGPEVWEDFQTRFIDASK